MVITTGCKYLAVSMLVMFDFAAARLSLTFASYCQGALAPTPTSSFLAPFVIVLFPTHTRDYSAADAQDGAQQDTVAHQERAALGR